MIWDNYYYLCHLFVFPTQYKYMQMNKKLLISKKIMLILNYEGERTKETIKLWYCNLKNYNN